MARAMRKKEEARKRPRMAMRGGRIVIGMACDQCRGSGGEREIRPG